MAVARVPLTQSNTKICALIALSRSWIFFVDLNLVRKGTKMDKITGRLIELMNLVDGKITGMVRQGNKAGLCVRTVEGDYQEIWFEDFQIDDG
jgi:hypothetical protein